mgnify:CR=1 FL=1
MSIDCVNLLIDMRLVISFILIVFLLLLQISVFWEVIFISMTFWGFSLIWGIICPFFRADIILMLFISLFISVGLIISEPFIFIVSLCLVFHLIVFGFIFIVWGLWFILILATFSFLNFNLIKS